MVGETTNSAERDRLIENRSKLSSELETLKQEMHKSEKIFRELQMERARADYKRTVFLLLTTLAFLIPMMLLYIGFFITLRNSIVSILEILALKEKILVERE